MFRYKNETHDIDRERATSLLPNLRMPKDLKILKRNPFFNKEKFPEREINLKSPNLFQIGQIELKDYVDQS